MVDEYMKKIGFGDQPYYVYQHHDSGHPHVHVLSTTIRNDGSRINTHNLGKDISKPVTEELEKKYGLTKADDPERQKEKEQLQKADAQKAQAGKSETKRAITNVLDTVIDKYKYTSFDELNAILRDYNIKADRGQPGSRIYNNRGLTYSILDEKGEAATKPIKASEIYSKPTLDKIEEKSRENEDDRDKEKRQLKTAVEWAMQKNPKSLEELTRTLQKEGISIHVSRSKDGKIFGLTYVDHQNKSVFKGSDLGKENGAKPTLERINNNNNKEQQAPAKELPSPKKEQDKTVPGKQARDVAQHDQVFQSFAPKIDLPNTGKLIEQVVQPEGEVLPIMNSPTKKKKTKTPARIRRRLMNY